MDTLDSYRGRLTLWIKLKDGSETTDTSTLEWVRELPSGHYVYTKSDGEVEERFVIGDTAWIKVTADSWSQVLSPHGPGGQGFEYIAAPITRFALSALESDGSGTLASVTLLDEETVNGIHCKRYIHDESALLWVADQSDLPSVIVRVLFQPSPSEASNIQETKQELDLYDLNAPITIEPPQ